MKHKIIQHLLYKKIHNRHSKTGIDPIPESFLCKHFHKSCIRDPHGPQNSELMFPRCHQILHAVHNMQQADQKQHQSDSIEKYHFLCQIKILRVDLLRIIFHHAFGYIRNHIPDLLCRSFCVRLFFQRNTYRLISCHPEVFFHLFIGHNNVHFHRAAVADIRFHFCQRTVCHCRYLKFSGIIQTLIT